MKHTLELMQDLQKSLPDIDGSIPMVSMALAGDRIIVQAMWQLGLAELFKVRREYSPQALFPPVDVSDDFVVFCKKEVAER